MNRPALLKFVFFTELSMFSADFTTDLMLIYSLRAFGNHCLRQWSLPAPRLRQAGTLARKSTVVLSCFTRLSPSVAFATAEDGSAALKQATAFSGGT